VSANRSPAHAARTSSRLALVLLMVVVLGGCDWLGRLFDPAHGGSTSDSGLSAGNVGALTQKWRLRAPGCSGAGSGGGWLATPAESEGVIYEGSNSGCLYALKESDGTVLWSKFSAFQPSLTCQQRLGIVSSVTVVAGDAGEPVLFFHSPDGYLYKLNSSDGSTIWRSVVQIPSTTVNDVYAWSSPTVANGKVIVGVSSNCDTPFVQGQVRAYDARTGALLWTHKLIPDGFVGAGDWYDAAVDDAGYVYVSTGSTTDATAVAHPNTTPGFEQYSLLKLDGTTGALIWKAPAPKYAGDPDYASSPILFRGGGVDLVGGTNKDGWFRVYRQDNGVEVWQALVGTATADGNVAPLSDAVWDGTHLFVMGNATTTGGTWATYVRLWAPIGGTSAPGSIRELDPATGNLVRVGGQPFELALPSNPLGPCSINGNGILVCAGGNLSANLAGHDNGLFIVDTTKPPSILRHLEDTRNFGEFAQPVQENGSILAASIDALVKWGH
jgi:outer membrane protein assembly factor BamB